MAALIAVKRFSGLGRASPVLDQPLWAGRPQLLRQPEGLEQPLHPSAGLGQTGTGCAGSEPRERPAEPGSACSCRPGRPPSACGSSGCRGRCRESEQALGRDHLAKCGERAHGPFLVDQEGGIDVGGGVVHGRIRSKLRSSPAPNERASRPGAALCPARAAAVASCDGRTAAWPS